MGLTDVYCVAPGRIPDLFEKVRDGQAPDQVTQQLLKDWGFASSNDRVFLRLLKELGFLSPDGKPTSAYHEYRDHTRSRATMASALRDAYQDVFLIKAHPVEGDRPAIQGKFKSYHNVSDHVAKLMTNTFFALLKLADLSSKKPNSASTPEHDEPKAVQMPAPGQSPSAHQLVTGAGLHYNIQIHLPATKDVEVYNAIFKSVREHLLAD